MLNLFKKAASAGRSLFSHTDDLEDDKKEDVEILKPNFDADSNQTNGSSEPQLYKEIAELSKNGYHLIDEGLIDDAIFCFKRILELEPNNSYALVGLGDASRKQRNFDAALEYYNKVLANNSDNNYALFGVADCYKAMRQFTKAIEIWIAYLKFDPKNITVLTRIADSYRKIRDFRLAKDYYDQALAIDSTNLYVLIGLAHLHYNFQEFETSLNYWKRVLDYSGDEPNIRALTSCGNCYRKLKLFEKGLEYFFEALDIEPENFYVLFGIADCYRGLHRNEESIKYWEKILVLDPNNKVILTRLGDAYRGIGNLQKAQICYEEALSIDYDTYAVLGLALVNMENRHFDEALQLLLNDIERDPKNNRFYIEAANCYMAMDNKPAAIKILQDCKAAGINNIAVNRKLEELGA